ncbi:MAG: polysaccharide biosynthesis/export family protein [Janthinobacterium lividum]
MLLNANEFGSPGSRLIGVRRRGALLGGVALLIAGCTAGHNLPPLPDYQAGAYRLGVGDLLRVLTFGEEQLTGEFRVDDQGQIAMPLIGSVPATGRSAKQLESDISRALVKGDFLKNPHITVEIIAYRPIFVLGEVAKPGQYPYQPGMTFLTAVAVAGGFTYRAVQEYGEVVRTNKGTAINGRVTSNTFLAPGDVVQVVERYF